MWWLFPWTPKRSLLDTVPTILLLGESGAGSLAETLFLPRIAVHVVAVALPETRLIVIQKLDACYPLRALPGVELRHDQSRGTAVLGGDGLPVVKERHQCILG